MTCLYHAITVQEQTTQNQILGVVVIACLMTQNKFVKKKRMVILWFNKVTSLAIKRQILQSFLIV